MGVAVDVKRERLAARLVVRMAEGTEVDAVIREKLEGLGYAV